MVCIYCGNKTQVTNSRAQKKSNQTWRRRRCLDCQAVFTSEERPLYEQNWLVVNRSGSSKPFSRDKLFLSLHNSLRHRKTALEDAAFLTETVMHKLMSYANEGHLHSKLIAQTAQVALNRFDKPASITYEAFHP